MRNAQTQAEKPKKSRRQWSKEADFAGMAARVEHALSPEAPSRRSDAVDPKRRKARPEKAERSLHPQTESEDSLAGEGHAPSFGD
jgi:hypothetical protein